MNSNHNAGIASVAGIGTILKKACAVLTMPALFLQCLFYSYYARYACMMTTMPVLYLLCLLLLYLPTMSVLCLLCLYYACPTLTVFVLCLFWCNCIRSHFSHM